MNYFKTLVATSLLANVHAQVKPPSLPRGCANGKFMGHEYQSQTASAKLFQLWSELTADTSAKEHDWVATESLFTRDMNLTFDKEGDELP